MRKLLLLLVLLFCVAAVSAAWDDARTEVLPVQLQKEYLTVVGKDAPTTDVITAANFAASMSATLGKKFSGVTDEDVLTHMHAADIDSRLLVVINGNRVLLSVGFGSTMNEVADAVETYFDGQGFLVTRKESAAVFPQDLAVTFVFMDSSPRNPVDEVGPIDEADEPPSEWEPQDDVPEPYVDACDGCSYQGECFAVGTGVVKDGSSHYCSSLGILLPQKGAGAACDFDYECVGSSCDDRVCRQRGQESETDALGVTTGVSTGTETPVSGNLIVRFFGWLKELFS